MASEDNRLPIVDIEQVDELDRQYPGDIKRGYDDGYDDKPWPDAERLVTPAYEWGHRNGVSDRTGHVDVEQRLVAASMVRRERVRRVMKEFGVAAPDGERQRG